MLTSSSMSATIQEPGRKRSRETEPDAGNVGLGEHRNKRLHCLPLRRSPRAAGGHDAWQQESFQHVEMDMMDSSYHAEDDLMLHDPQGSGRIPTPTQPSHGPVLSNLNGVVNLGHHSSGLSDSQSVPRALSGATDWQAMHHDMRLCPPITENDLAPNQTIGSLAMMLDESNNAAMLPPDVIALATPHHAMNHPHAMMDVESSPTHHMEVERESPSPGSVKKGHVRSKHTIDSWTWQPGMKRSFSIGYRADCEKCRLKVPGHFNHIVIS